MNINLAQAGDSELVMELFTSQGCYSCPPAEKLFGEKFIKRPGLLALEFHVDYWDELVYGFAGNWKDPFSDSRFSKRQRRYAASFQENSVFTPQAVVQGATALSATDQNGIEFHLNQASELDLGREWDVQFSQEGKDWQAKINGVGNVDAYTIVFLPEIVTEVEAGENKGKTLTNHNVVIRYEPNFSISEGEVIQIGKLTDNQQCAIILQKPNQGVILGGWRCQSNNG